MEGFAGERWTQSQEAALRWRLRWVRSEARDGLSRDPRLIHQGANSGYQAINLAYLLGASRILLLGFDMKPAGRRMHWFGDHPGKLRKALPFPQWIKNFDALAADLRQAGITVLNCTPGSALTCFPRADLAEALNA